MTTISFNNKIYSFSENEIYKLYFSNNGNPVNCYKIKETKTNVLFYTVKSNMFISVNKKTLNTKGYSKDYKVMNKTTIKKGYSLNDCGFTIETAFLIRIEK